MKKFFRKFWEKSFPQDTVSFPQTENVLDTMSKNTYKIFNLLLLKFLNIAINKFLNTHIKKQNGQSNRTF